MKLLKALTLIALLALIILAFIGGIKDVFGEEYPVCKDFDPLVETFGEHKWIEHMSGQDYVHEFKQEIRREEAMLNAKDFTLKYGQKGVVVHHSDSFVDTVETIDAYHKSKGWDGIGYHFVIYRNGEVHKGRDINKQGAHAIGRNHMTGICLIGKDNYSDNQLRSLITLLNDLGYPIENHHEECP